MDFDLLNYKGEFKFGEWNDFVSAVAIWLEPRWIV